MEKVILHTQKRKECGKTNAKKLRKQELIPTVCYKDGKEPMNLKVNKRDLEAALHTKAGENVLITLKIDDEKAHKEKTVIIKEIQRDPIKEEIMHVDFKEISLTEKIKVKVPVVSHGEAQEVIREDGIIEHIIWEIDIECLPTDIPEKIEVEVSQMKIGDTVYVKDLKIPTPIKVLNDPELVVLTAKPPAKEEVKLEEAAEEITEPEVIEKGKKEAEEEIAEEAPPPKKEKEEKKE